MDDFSDPNHLPDFLDDVLSTATMEDIITCKNEISCVFDATQTGSIAVGIASMEVNTQNTLGFALAGKD